MENKEKYDKNAKKIKKVIKKHIDIFMQCLLPLAAPKVLEDYPEYLNGCPKKLSFKYQKHSANTKTRQEKEKSCNGRETKSNETSNDKSQFKIKDVSQKDFLAALDMRQSEALKITFKTIENSLIKIGNGIDEKSVSFNDKSSAQRTITIRKKDIINSNDKSLSDTSSDEDDNLMITTTLLTPKCSIERIDCLGKKLQSHKTKQTKKAEKSKPLNSKILKEAFKKCNDFDEAMKKYTTKKKELDKLIVSRKIIPTPLKNPSQKVTKRTKKSTEFQKKNSENPNHHLGGIFTINNGWDKTELQAYKIPKIRRTVTPPKIVIDQNIDDIMEAHEEFMQKENYVESNNGYFSPNSDENFKSSNNQPNVIEELPKKSSINSSEKSEESDCDIPSTSKPPEKIRKISCSDDEEPMKAFENFKRLSNRDNHDVLSLCADYGSLDDFEEEEENCVIVDDLKIMVEKKVKDPVDYKADFEANTKEISQHIVDPETDKILKTFFHNVCPAFLENRCTNLICKQIHAIAKVDIIRESIIKAPYNQLSNIFQVAIRFYRLFQSYISIFVEISINNHDDKGLIELVKACDKHPRTIVCYKDIVNKLVEMGYMKQHRAISFIIEHHTDSAIARDTILTLIIESGPCLVYFMDYIEYIHSLQPIRLDLFNQILHICVSLQNPRLPNFCLNYMHVCPIQQFGALDLVHLRKFLMLNKCLSELNESRESKSLILTQKLLQSGRL